MELRYQPNVLIKTTNIRKQVQVILGIKKFYQSILYNICTFIIEDKKKNKEDPTLGFKETFL